ncbi:MAG: TonB family protein [candidate division WOR-3 bacterium]|nr:MAG: TonB family protein [candidate division WOR-3 bacterium]
MTKSLPILLLPCLLLAVAEAGPLPETRFVEPDVTPGQEAWLPDPDSVTAATMELIGSFRVCRVQDVWPLPDGSCWVLADSGFYTGLVCMNRRISADGRRIGQDVDWHRSAEISGLAALPDGDLIAEWYPVGCISSSPVRLARIGDGRLKGVPPDVPASFLSARTTLVDSDGVVHLFGWGGAYGQVYVRYSTNDDTIVELSRKAFTDRCVFDSSTGWQRVPLRESLPFGRRGSTVLTWDIPGVVVGVEASPRRPSTAGAVRFDVPHVAVQDSTSFDFVEAATRVTTLHGSAEPELVRTEGGFWTYLPEKVEGEQPYFRIHACHLSRDLTPDRTGATTYAEPRPFLDAPRGSKVTVTTTHRLQNDFRPKADSADVFRHWLTLRFLAFGPDGYLYLAETSDSLEHRLPVLLDTSSSAVLEGGGDSLVAERLALPTYPVLARADGIEGMSIVTSILAEDGSVDSAWVSKSSGNSAIDMASLQAARASRFSGRALEASARTLRCETTYRFNLTGWPRQGETNIGFCRLLQGH